MECLTWVLSICCSSLCLQRVEWSITVWFLSPLFSLSGIQVVSLLVKSGADPSKPNAHGVTPLQAAVDDEDDRMLAILSGHKDPGEVCSPKGTPRKSQQFAKHEKRESPKKTTQYARPEESLVVSFPLQKVRSVKTRLKFDHILSEQEGVKPIAEEVKPLEEEGSISVEDEEEEATVEGGLEPAGAQDKEDSAAKGSGALAGKGAGLSEREKVASASTECSDQLEEEEDDMETGGEGKNDTEEPAACSTEGKADADEEKPSTDESRGKDVGSPVERHSPPSPSPPPVGRSKESKEEDKAAKKEEVPRELQCTERCDPEVAPTTKREKEIDKGEEKEGAEDDSKKPKPKMRSPPPPPLTLSLPPDHTYCGPAVPGRTPPPRPTLSHDSHVITPTSGYSSPLDCLLQAAEGSMYLSSSPLSASSHKGGTMSKSTPKIASPQMSSSTPKTSTATLPMSFPVSLSFSKYNLPYPRSAPPTPSNSAVDPLFSLATIATSSSPMPSTSSTSRTLKVRQSSIPSLVTRTTPRQDATSGRLREKGRGRQTVVLTKVLCGGVW